MKTIFFILFFATLVFPQQKHMFRIETGAVFTHYQAQVKPNVGEPRGERLYNEFQLGLHLSGLYTFWKYMSGGIFIRIDRGERAAAEFNRFENGKAITEKELGGVYTEFWTGPLLRFDWSYLSVEAGYAVVGLRNDDGRRDIYNSKGENTGAFSVLPGIAWLFSLGGNFTVTNNIDVIVKLEYRPRYYSKRSGEPLLNDIEHGTQSISPLIGLGWRL